MTPENFVYWLQGFFELAETQEQPLTTKQVQVIKNHIALVLNKVTPEVTDTTQLPEKSIRLEEFADLVKKLGPNYNFDERIYCANAGSIEEVSTCATKTDEDFSRVFEEEYEEFDDRQLELDLVQVDTLLTC